MGRSTVQAALRFCNTASSDFLTGSPPGTRDGQRPEICPARWVIHTVGPNYKAGQRDRSLLESCYRRSLEVADELGARNLAFPLVSTGAYRWPGRDAVATAIETITTTDTGVEQVRLVAFGGGGYELLSELLGA